MTGEHTTPGRRPASRKHADQGMTPAAGSRSWHGADQASRAMADILAGPVVWGGVGWLADRWLGTDPWLLSTGIMVGFAGGLYIVWLRTKPQAGRLRAAGTDDEGDQHPEG